MFKFVCTALAALCFSLPSNSQAKTFKADPDRLISFVGVIRSDVLPLASQIEKFSQQSTKPIYLLINSPGGSVIAGLQVLSAMKVAKERGVVFKCFTPVMAASMAFQILVNCNERYSLNNSLLLWHPMRASLQGSFTSEELLYEGGRLKALEKPLVLDLIRVLKISPNQFFYHYRHETMWTGDQINELSPGFLQIVDDFTGIKGAFDLGN